jgi:hypothetical protein
MHPARKVSKTADKIKFFIDQYFFVFNQYEPESGKRYKIPTLFLVFVLE